MNEEEFELQGIFWESVCLSANLSSTKCTSAVLIQFQKWCRVADFKGR